jgi:hypothetical protein
MKCSMGWMAAMFGPSKNFWGKEVSATTVHTHIFEQRWPRDFEPFGPAVYETPAMVCGPVSGYTAGGI